MNNFLVLQNLDSDFARWWRSEGLNVRSPWKTRFEHNKAALYSFFGCLDKLLGFTENDVKKYDTIILPETGGSVYIAKMIRKWNSKAEIIFPMANIIAEFGPEKVKPLKDLGVKILHYDKDDVAKYHLYHYEGMIYPLQTYILPKREITTDLYFIGQDKGRLKTVLQVQEQCQRLGLRTDFTIVLERKSRYGEGEVNGVKFLKEQIPYEKVLEGIASSRMILDITQPGQRGITLRPFESFNYRKKLISNNPSIREMNYYHQDNMMVWDGSNFDDIILFMELPYHEMPQEIYDYYTVKKNFERILEAVK